MHIPLTVPSPTELGNRLKRAALGFGVTVAPLCAVACVQLLLAPNIVARAGFNPVTDSWVVSDYRNGLVSSYAWIVATVFAYWLLTFTLGRGQILGIKSANVTLGGSILTFALAMVIASIVPVPSELFKWACTMLGISDTYSGFGFDRPTPCGAFANQAAPTVLLGLPLFFLAASVALRIVVSRWRWRRGVR